MANKNQVQETHFFLRLPKLEDELLVQLKKTRKELNDLPSPPSRDPKGEIYRLVTSFTQDLSRCIEGSPEADGILQSIRPLQEKFRKAIRATAPNFRPYKRGGGGGKEFYNPGFLSNEEQMYVMPNNQTIIHVDEVMAMALRYVLVKFPRLFIVLTLLQSENKGTA